MDGWSVDTAPAFDTIKLTLIFCDCLEPHRSIHAVLDLEPAVAVALGERLLQAAYDYQGRS